MERLKRIILVIVCCALSAINGDCNDVLIAQQPKNRLADFVGLESISVVHFVMPDNVFYADFKFTAQEEKLSGLGGCEPRNVTVDIKYGSLPLARPDNALIASKLLLSNRPRIRTYDFMSDGDVNVFRIDKPTSGDWYAIAYRSWINPNDDKIKQEGLSANCETILFADLSIRYFDRTLRAEPNSNHEFELTKRNSTTMMEFRVPHDATVIVDLTSSCGYNCTILVTATASGTNDVLYREIVNASATTANFTIHAAYCYLALELNTGNESVITTNLTYRRNEEETTSRVEHVHLTRTTHPNFFTFDYEHTMINRIVSVPVKNDSLTVLKFEIGTIHDTGGTLSVGLMSAEKKTNDPKDDNSIRIVGCLSLNAYATINTLGRCGNVNQRSRAADVWSRGRGEPDFVHVPYPEPGTWHLAIRAFKLNDSGCDCFDRCAVNETTICNDCECADIVDTNVNTSIGSSLCVNDDCNGHGRCLPSSDRGIVFGACYCTGGYRGFDCADDVYVLNKIQAVVRLVMLTCSNLAFVGAIAAAIKRQYHTEALVYTSVMFFSTFYHACDAENYNFCIYSSSVLQFGDFYSALLAIWVTLVAMASLGRRVTSFCHMLGVIFIAIGTESDRRALWVFLVPACVGFCIILVSWIIKYRRKGTLDFLPRTYRLIYLPIGLGIIIIGLVCYAFLQTRSNYYIVHSVWHACSAIGTIFLLPSREYTI